jgi:hypothetical protein
MLYLLVISKTTCTSALAVMLCEVVVSYPAPDRQKPPPRTQFLLSSWENLRTGQTKRFLPAGHFENDLSNCCCCQVVSSCRGLPWTWQTKTATTHAILALQSRKLAEGPNRPCPTCWLLQKRPAKLLLSSSCVELLWVTLDLANKNRHHTRSSCFPVGKTCRRAKQTVLYLLHTSKTTCQTVVVVELCRVAVGYPGAGEQKPPPRPQFLLSS